MVNVLFEYPQLNCGGTEMVMYNLAKFFNPEQFHVDILARIPGNNEQIFRDLGCKIFYVPFADNAKYKRNLTAFLRTHHYDVVHTHMHSEMGLVMQSANKAGVTVRVAHSHNARVDVPRILWPLNIVRNWQIETQANMFFACSRIAAEWMFPRHRRTAHVIYNAIDLDAFRFDAEVRNERRRELGVSDDTKVVINVGRCTEQKNHHFIIERAKAMLDEDILYVIIGEGPLFDELQKRITDEHITNVRMMGKRLDVPQWLCAADVFIFPSIYEGLGIVAVEAQAAGLRVLSTDTIPVEADMQMGSFERIPLSDMARWEQLLLEDVFTPARRVELSEKAFSSHYNIRVVAKEVEELYKSLI